MSTSQFWIDHNAVTRLLRAVMLQIDHISLKSSIELSQLRSELLSLYQEFNVAAMLVGEAEVHHKSDSNISLDIQSLQNIFESITDPSKGDIGISGSVVPSLLRLLPPDETLAQLHQTDIPLATKDLQSIRRRASLKSKNIMSRLRAQRLKVDFQESENIYTEDELFAKVLREFSQKPFALQPHSTLTFPIDPANGVTKQYQGPMKQIARWWFTKLCSQEATIAASVRAETALMGQLWVETVESLRNMDLYWAESQESTHKHFDELLESLDQGLRDALYRQGTDANVAVFIGAQNSGKSTFINKLIGSDVLPIGVGAVTALPCRIVHVPGQHVPELSVDVTILNTNINLIRQIPVDVKRKHPKYASCSQKSLENLVVFEKEGFELQSPVQGAQNVQTTLEYINDIIRFSKMYGFAYNGLNDENWAVVSFHFPKLPTPPTTGRIELIDLPGLMYDDTQYRWRMTASEAIRRANVVVAIVSSIGFYDNPVWHALPDVIAEGSHIRATVVAATKVDLLPEDDREPVRRGIIERFWPEAIENPKLAGIYIECSAQYEESIEAINGTLKEATSKPSFTELQTGYSERATQYIFRGKKGVYDSLTLEELRETVKEYEEQFSLRAARNEIFERLKGGTRLHYYLEEARGLSRMLEKILAVIEDQSVTLRLSPRDISGQKTFHSDLEVNTANIRSKWNDNLRELKQDFNSLTKRAADSVISRLDSDITNEWLKQTSSNDRKELQVDDVAVFDSEADLLYFLDATQKALRSRLEALQLETLQELKKDAMESYKARLSNVIQAVGSIDPQAQQELEGLTPFSSYEPSSSPLISDLADTDAFVEKQLVSGRRTPNFRQTQERILGHLTGKRQRESVPPPSINSLSPLLRALLATVSFVPFALYYPFSSRLPASTTFKVDLNGLRKAYRETILLPWTDHFSVELQRALQQPEDKAGSILDSAIQSALQESAERLQKLNETPAIMVSRVITESIASNYCNVVAGREALEVITEHLVEGSTPHTTS